MLAVKATQNDDAAGWLARLCDEHTIVVVLQNGVEQVEQVKPLCPSSTVIPGIVWFSAETQPEGWVRLRTEAALVLPSGPAATTVAELLRGAGCRVDCDPDFITAAWRKLLTNALAGFMVLSGGDPECSAATTSPSCRAAMSPNAWRSRAPRARGCPTTWSTGWSTCSVRRPKTWAPRYWPTRESRRRMEWDIRNGVIIRKARAHGMATPISDVLVPLLAARQRRPG